MAMNNKTLRSLTAASMLAASFAIVACSSTSTSKDGAGEEVKECEAYASALRGCFGAENASASERASAQALALKTADPAERARMRAICSQDLVRLKAACH